jgi:hypothetical protein
MGERRGVYRVLVEKPEGKRPLGRPMHNWEDNINMIYLLSAIELPPSGSITVHIYRQTIHRTTQQFWKNAGRAPSWLVIPWHLPYNRGKSTEKPQSG